MTEPVLRVEELTAGYGGAAVLRNVNLVVGEGEVVAVLGPNGAGKTTTLRTISGIVSPMAGRIRCAGRDLLALSPDARARMGIAHVPEGRGVFFGLTVAEHFRLHHHGERLDEDGALRYFPALEKLRERRAGLLSGGEQQMLALGRALARRPKLLMIDELSLGLAPVAVERLLPVVRDYATDSGCGVLLIEQHVDLALGVADRGYVLSHGEVLLEADGDTLLSNPQLVLSSYLGEELTDRSAAAIAAGDRDTQSHVEVSE